MRAFFGELYRVKNFRILMLIALVSFVPALGAVHLFDWDEINFAESAREMMVTGDYFRVRINYEPFWEKPPLFFWMQSLSMHLFGVNEFGARFPNAVIGIITIAFFYFAGKKEKDEKFGLVWGSIYLCAFLPQIYFRSAIIDPAFNLFIFVSGYYLFKALHAESGKNKLALLSGIFCGLAVLTKGPVGFLLVFLTFVVYLLIKKFKVLPTLSQVGIFALSVLTMSFLWFGVEVMNNGLWFIIEFVEYQIELFSQPVAGHEQPFYYHFLVVFFGTFPLSVLALPILVKRTGLTELQSWMVILFWVVMILFSISKTKIAHYSSMTYLPLSFMAAWVLYHYKWSELKKYVKVIYWILAVLFTLIFAIVPLFGMLNQKFMHLFKDPFAQAGFGNEEVSWIGIEPILSLFILAAFLVFVFYMKRDQLLKAVMFKSIFVSVTLTLTLVLVVRNIEGYSQRPMIDFYESHQGEEIYVFPVGFKSYAQYFYFRQPQHPNAFAKIRSERYNNAEVEYKELEGAVKNWLLYEDIDYDAYFVSKINHEELDAIDHIELIDTKGGFKFYYRKKS